MVPRLPVASDATSIAASQRVGSMAAAANASVSLSNAQNTIGIGFFNQCELPETDMNARVD